MLQHLYNEAYDHYKLKIAVKHKLSDTQDSEYSAEHISKLVAHHALSYAKGDKSNTSDLRHKQLIMGLYLKV